MQDDREAIAIIGMAGRFPGARNLGEFWRNIADGLESISRFSDDELLASGVDPKVFASPRYVRAAGVLDDIEMFDAGFFGYSPREAETIDPQHRLFLEHAWEALEAAGYAPGAAENGSVGVFCGASPNSYRLNNLAPSRRPAADDIGSVVGNNLDFLATRVSYKLDLKGPSVVVQASCSTSLVAIAMACQSLLDYQSDLALAGGVSVNLPHRAGYLYQEEGIYSPDGHCRAFDADAGGTVGGNGVGVVVLKRLSEALGDRDRIHAVVKGWAINNDGADKIGFTAPSVNGQAEVIAMAQALAAVDPETIGYIETHGTGTRLGDPIEIAALTRAFRAGTEKVGFCAIGSLKTNIGHADAAAGVAGFIKTALALEHKTLPPSLNFREPNPEIDFPDSPFYVNTEARPWESRGNVRRAGVSSFGMGGTNAHAVLEEAPAAAASEATGRRVILVLSARTPGALDEATENLAVRLERAESLSLADVAYTLQVGRKRFPSRRVVVCDDREDALRSLRDPDSGRVWTHRETTIGLGVAFLFPGQGAQHVNMGAGLYEEGGVFRQHLDRCAALLEPHLDRGLLEVLYPPTDDAEADDRLCQTAFTQPALFAVEYALARQWIAWGVRPQAMIGHSIGEYVAACLAGVFDLEDALLLVAARGRLMQKLRRGAMMAVALPPAELEGSLDATVSIAAVNEPRQTVISGPEPAIERLRSELEAAGARCRRLQTSHAFHSAMMDSILEPFGALVRDTVRRPPEIPFVSNLTGTWIEDREAVDEQYWVQHLRQTVRFAAGIRTLLDGPRSALLEVGPGRTLSSLAVRQSDAENRPVVVPSMRHPKDEGADGDVLMGALGRLWLAGVDIDWSEFHAPERRCRVRLPTYPFERRRYWLEPEAPADGAESAMAPAGKTPDVADWLYVPSWRRLPPRQAASAGASGGGRCLLFAAGRLGEGLAGSLRARGSEVVVVRAGERYSELDDGSYTVRKGESADYEALISALKADDRRPDRVVHAWLATPLEPEQRPQETDALESGFYSLLALTRALWTQEMAGPLEMVVVVSQTQEVVGGEALCPTKATALGPCKVIPQEHTLFRCRVVDIDGSEAAAGDERLLRLLAAESTTAAGEPVVAYRRGHRWVQAFEPLGQVGIPSPAEGPPARLRQQGVYLITGGLGGVGLEVAEYLARTVQARLVLVGRTELPDNAGWAEELRQLPDDDDRARLLRKLISLESSGAEVLVLRGDVADEDEMRAALARAEERFGALHGVVHAAGEQKLPSIVVDADRDYCERQLRPKLRGLAVLERTLQERELDFCLVQSSLSSVLGALGYVAYAAAHQFVDCFVQQRSRDSAPWMAVNWDNWLTWKEPEIPSAYDAEHFMSAAEAAVALSHVFSCGPLPQLVVSTGDLPTRIGRWVGGETALEPSRARPVQEGDDNVPATRNLHPRPMLSSNFVAPSNEVERLLTDIWGEVLGIDQIGVHDNFFELGGDSVLGIQVVAKAAAADVRIRPNQLFEHPTVSELAGAAIHGRAQRAEQGEVTGGVPLTPIQRWFFELDLADPRHFNLPVLLELDERTDPGYVEEALQHLVAHHDALRLGYARRDATVEQFNRAAGERLRLTRIDVSGLEPEEREAEIATSSAAAQSGLDLFDGPLVRAALFELGGGRPRRLLIVAHHLIVDVVSWRILLEDLETALAQLGAGEQVRLPAKTTSFKAWAEWLEEHARSDEVRRERTFWEAQLTGVTPPLPAGRRHGPNLIASARVISSDYGAEQTQALLRDLPTAFNLRIHEALVAAIVLAFARGTGSRSLVIDIEGHGRSEVEGIDLSRTVGWFTAIYPVRFDIDDPADVAGACRMTKERLRSVPAGGIGFGLLRYSGGVEKGRDELRELATPEVSFLYMGQYENTGQHDRGAPDAPWFVVSDDDPGPPASPNAERTHELQILGIVRDGKLRIDWIYSANLHDPDAIAGLADQFTAALREIVAACGRPDSEGHTPSDFPAARVGQEQIDKLITRIKQAAEAPSD